MSKLVQPVDWNAYVAWVRSFPGTRRKRRKSPPVGYCAFCGTKDRAGRMIVSGEYLYAPMVRIDLWRRIGSKALRGVMCLACMRRRFGRPFIEWDFRKPWWRHELALSNGVLHSLPRH
jgi:hypothetical protein